MVRLWWLTVVVPSFVGLAQAQTKPESRASKFVVKTPQKVVPYGKPVEVQLKLSDADNQLRPAKQEIPAEITVKTPDGATQKFPVTFRPGESVKQVPIVVDRPGMWTSR